MIRSEIAPNFVTALILTVFISALAGCSPSKAPDPAVEKNVETKSSDVIPAYQLQALEKAKGVEKMADQHRKDMDNQGL
jgi:hypothetical protein